MFLKLTQGTLCLMGKYRVSIMKGVAMPALVYVALHAIRYWLARAEPPLNDIGSLLHIPFMLLDMAVIAVMVINTVRAVMLAEEQAVLKLNFAKREIKFFLYFLGFVVVWLIPAIMISVSVPLVFYSSWLMIIPAFVFLTALFFSLRLSLIFVGVAIDKSVSMRDSYVMTNGPKWAMCFAFVVFFCLLVAAHFFVGYVGEVLDLNPFYLMAYFFVYPFLDVLAYVMLAVALSLLYSESHQSVESPVGAM